MLADTLTSTQVDRAQLPYQPPRGQEVIIVLPEVNFRNPLHTCQKACKRGIHPFGFETQGRHHQKSLPSRKRLVSSKNFRKRCQIVRRNWTETMFGNNISHTMNKWIPGIGETKGHVLCVNLLALHPSTPTYSHSRSVQICSKICSNKVVL